MTESMSQREWDRVVGIGETGQSADTISPKPKSSENHTATVSNISDKKSKPGDWHNGPIPTEYR